MAQQQWLIQTLYLGKYNVWISFIIARLSVAPCSTMTLDVTHYMRYIWCTRLFGSWLCPGFQWSVANIPTELCIRWMNGQFPKRRMYQIYLRQWTTSNIRIMNQPLSYILNNHQKNSNYLINFLQNEIHSNSVCSHEFYSLIPHCSSFLGF
jgi:hypothetical protein